MRTALVALTFLYGFTGNYAKPVDEHNPVEVCDSDECKDTAHVLLNSMNFSVNPCDDFYEYACGNWIKKHPLPSTTARWGQTNVVKEQVLEAVQEILSASSNEDDHESLVRSRIFYKSCIDGDTMNERGLEPLAALVRNHGGWPLIQHKAWDESKFNLQDALSDIKRNLGLGILVEVAIEPDLKSAEKHSIYVDQPSFFVSRDALLDPTKYKVQFSAYRNLLWDVATALNEAEHPAKPLKPQYLNKRIQDIIDFETQLANISTPTEKRRVVDSVYNPFTIQDFQLLNDETRVSNYYAKMNWLKFLHRIMKPIGGVEESHVIIVKQPKYMQELVRILDNTPLETIANYVQWMVVSALITETTDKMREAQFRFDKASEGLRKRKTLVKKCSDLGLLSSYYPIGYAVGTEYIKTKFTPEAKDDVAEMVQYLRDGFTEMLVSATWLDGHTKERALEKIKAMRQFIGYPDWLTNSTAVTEYFQGMEIQEGKHFENQVSILSWWMEKSIRQWRKPVDRNDVKLHPVLLNAMYSPDANSITFPAGILEPVFYRHNGHRAVNFGGIGVVIGHEITHGFDLKGSQYDEDGNAVNWWTPTIKAEFEARANGIVEQYSAFRTAAGNVNGRLTVTENIADNGGLREAYLSYRNWVRDKNNNAEEPRLPGLESLSPDQLFFLGFANLWCQSDRPEAVKMQLLTDEHSPSRFRTLGPFMNSDAFAQAWSCPQGSPMNPQVKRVVW